MKRGRARQKTKTWFVVSLLIPSKFEEALSNFLMEQGAAGIEERSETPPPCPPTPVPTVGGASSRPARDGSPSLHLKAYFPEPVDRRGLVTRLRRYLRSVQKMFPETFHVNVEHFLLAEQDWGEDWKRHFKPTSITPRIIVKPPWSPFRPRGNRILIEIIPGLAFGTGTHATTRLCVRALEKRLRKKGSSVLDLGTGSAILSIIAARLGASEVWGVDPDEFSVGIARENVERNGVSHVVRIRKGRIGDIRKRFDFIVANIDMKALRKIRWPLARHLKKQGFLVLAGILHQEERRLRRHYLGTGCFQWVEGARQDEWVCLTLRRNGKAAR